jgi:twinkle protein
MIQEFEALGIIPKGRTVKQKVKCPKCSPTRKNKHDQPLSIDLEKGLYNCHNCGYRGNVKIKDKVEYTKPKESKAQVGEKMLEYFKSRGISESTVANWKITQSSEYFGSAGKKLTAINFNYFIEDDLVNIKYRSGGKDFKLVSGAKLVFYGLNNIKDSDTAYIVEGEFDALSLNEAGIYSVVSVPNGASKGSQRLEYLDNSHEYFKDKKQIIIATDNDEAGVSLRYALARRFGQYRCKYIDFKDFKDANDVLVSEGKEKLREIISEPLDFPLEGVLNIDNIWDSVLNYGLKGVENYSIGLGADDLFNVAFGEWSVVTGIPNSGKSDVIDQVCVNMAMIHDHRIAMFSPESYPYEGHIRRIANKINCTNCDEELLNKSKSFIEEHFYFIKIDLENITLKNILDRFRELVFQKGINVCVIDPFNMLQHDEHFDLAYISKILGTITQFCQQTNTHLFLVAHPRKMEAYNGTYKVPTPYDISGSSDFFNKAYNCITVYRRLGEKTSFGSDMCEVFVQKVKRKENGSQGSFLIAPNFKDGGGYYKPLNANTKLIGVEKY